MVREVDLKSRVQTKPELVTDGHEDSRPSESLTKVYTYEVVRSVGCSIHLWSYRRLNAYGSVESSVVQVVEAEGVGSEGVRARYRDHKLDADGASVTSRSSGIPIQTRGASKKST